MDCGLRTAQVIKRPYLKNIQHKKVEEHLCSMHEALSSNPVLPKDDDKVLKEPVYVPESYRAKGMGQVSLASY
jgi:hypothetical protein